MSKNIFFARQLLMLLLLLFVAPTFASDAETSLLSVKPARCIALHEGQACYQTLTIKWQAPTEDDYCLYEQDTNTPVLCWEKLSNGTGNYEFVNKNSVQLILKRKRDRQAVATFMIEVAWVYDAHSRRESHWKIF